MLYKSSIMDRFWSYIYNRYTRDRVMEKCTEWLQNKKPESVCQQFGYEEDSSDNPSKLIAWSQQSDIQSEDLEWEEERQILLYYDEDVDKYKVQAHMDVEYAFLDDYGVRTHDSIYKTKDTEISTMNTCNYEFFKMVKQMYREVESWNKEDLLTKEEKWEVEEAQEPWTTI